MLGLMWFLKLWLFERMVVMVRLCELIVLEIFLISGLEFLM